MSDSPFGPLIETFTRPEAPPLWRAVLLGVEVLVAGVPPAWVLAHARSVPWAVAALAFVLAVRLLLGLGAAFFAGAAIIAYLWERPEPPRPGAEEDPSARDDRRERIDALDERLDRLREERPPDRD